MSETNEKENELTESELDMNLEIIMSYWPTQNVSTFCNHYGS